ncbi:amino acid ABC transporter permease [Ahrensia sp. 13_GOM-1096m]|uniref:amino acid ABC transporter permease n=1 Tax=Ahrensia sp. 13_GOM-1096m TaxID=1380380 RepID=UPI00047DC71F|nr:amino acid ABC transporter permease [Ahrensia sp. 13_GOM-1096m]
MAQDRNHSLAYIRTEMVQDQPAPINAKGPVAWLRQNLFATIPDTLFTIFALLLLVYIIPPMFRFLITDAIWTGDSREACIVPGAGACWAFVDAKFAQFMYGRYPFEERWRVDLTGILLVAGVIPLAMPSVPYKKWNAIFVLIIFPILAFILLTGKFGLEPVQTSLWGGLLVTLVVAIVGIVVSFPFGIFLALGRRSNMPIIKMLSIIFIEFWRGVPLITVLFMSSVMLPFFLPDGVSFDKLLRALVGVTLFASAYMAEVIRGGLQAIPKGQYEAGDAMALTFWQSTRLIILPQALTLVIPGIVNTFIGLFKDTTLVLIIGIFDLLGIVQLNFTDANWASSKTPATGLIFAAIIYFIFCFGMSRYSMYMERRLDTGHKS